MNKYVLSLAFLLLSLLASPVFLKAHAADKGALHLIHLAIDKEYRENSIVKTALSSGITLVISLPSHVVLGRNPDEVSNCSLVVRDLNIDGSLSDINIPETLKWIDRSALDADDKQALKLAAMDAAKQVSGYEPDVCNFNNTPLSITESHMRGSGSLLGMATAMDSELRRQEIPVNLALFFKDYAQDIPIVRNTAFAQTDDTYIGANLVYSIWKLVRNISLGIMSLILLVVGFMIMTRKQMPSRTVVTVQYALPRVVLSIVLIFFSYPIGALIVKIMLPLIESSWDIFTADILPMALANTGWADKVISLVAGGMTTLLGLAILFLASMVFNFAMGAALLFFLILVIAALVIVILIALVRVVMIYVKLLSYIIVSPLFFAIGAIPGKENMIGDWFKEMLAGVLSVFAMSLTILVAVAAPFFAVSVAVSGSFFNTMIGALFLPVFMLYILAASIKMPKKVGEWVKGDQKRR